MAQTQEWTEKEVQMLMGYIQSSDEETLNEKLDFARYMLHHESGFNFPSRSLASVKNKYYELLKALEK
jgi:hypothetical protein